MKKFSMLLCLAAASLVGTGATLADSTYVVADPPVAFDVNDLEPFDGLGDSGPYIYFGVVRGTVGEQRAMAEFDVSGFTVPAGETISSALFQVQISHNVGGGMGCPWGQLPLYLAVHGYTGNGVADLSDFEAGGQNSYLDRVPTADAQIGDILTFDVTDYVRTLVDAGERWIGLTVQAQTVGALAIWDGPAGFPNLTINTVSVPEPATLAILAAGALLVMRRR